MINSVNELLPIGTVVKLKKEDKKIVVMGVMQNMRDGVKSKLYDYMGLPYPEGFINNESRVVFDQEDLDKIYFLGFSDIERQQFLTNISIMLEKLVQSHNKPKEEETNESEWISFDRYCSKIEKYK